MSGARDLNLRPFVLLSHTFPDMTFLVNDHNTFTDLPAVQWLSMRPFAFMLLHPECQECGCVMVVSCCPTPVSYLCERHHLGAEPVPHMYFLILVACCRCLVRTKCHLHSKCCFRRPRIILALEVFVETCSNFGPRSFVHALGSRQVFLCVIDCVFSVLSLTFRVIMLCLGLLKELDWYHTPTMQVVLLQDG